MDDTFVVVQILDDQLGISLNYYETIKFLLDQGLKVFRVGDKNIKFVLEHDSFFDLTQIDSPSEVNIFLCGKAKFYFGPAYGLYSVAHNFGVPCCITASMDYGGVRPNNFVQYLKFEDNNEKKSLSFSDFCTLGLNSCLSFKVINERELTPQIPSSEQNVALAQEMLEYLREGPIFQLNAKAKTKKYEYKIFGALCSESLSLII